MRYRTLGKTGLKVSILSLGASPLGSVTSETDIERGKRTVDIAIALGINYIDVSPYYGQTRAETILGQALRSIPRDKYYLATKVGRYGDNVEDCDYSPQRVTQSVDESLQRLGVDHVDIIQVHDVEFGDINQIIHETIPALRQVQQQGKARFVGITGLPLHLLTRISEETDIDTVLSYCHFTLNDTALRQALPVFQRKNVGVINAAPLAMGLLADQGPPSWHPAPKELVKMCASADVYVQNHGSRLSKLAIQFSTANDDIPTTLVNTASPETLRKYAQWALEPYDDELMAKVQDILAPVHNLTWQTGRAENAMTNDEARMTKAPQAG